VEALGAAAVPREPDVGEGEPLAHAGALERLRRAVRRGGVDHRHPVERMRLARERLEAGEQQLPAVVRHHHRLHARHQTSPRRTISAQSAGAMLLKRPRRPSRA
jgi:hypothetical protein